MRKLILLIVISFSASIAAAQNFDFNNRCTSAYEAIISLQFNRAEELLQEEKHLNPNNLIPLYLDNYIDFLKLVIGESKDSLDMLEEYKDQRLEAVKEGPEESPYYKYCLANINMQWAFSRLKFREYFTAFFEVRRAFKLFEENHEEHPEFLPNYTGLGLLHILTGSVPESYKWITNTLGLQGNINQGIRELKKVLKGSATDPQHKALAIESIFYLTFVQLNISPEEEQTKQWTQIMDTISVSGPLIIFAKANFYQKTGQNEKVLQVLQKRFELDYSYPFYYLDYMHGIALLNKIDPEAIDYFTKYVEEFNGSSYIASARQKTAWLYLLQGNTSKYHIYMDKVLESPESVIGTDDEAKREASSKELPDTTLLKARLLSDGGYYLQALETLNRKSAEDYWQTENKTEYYYRKGRILQQMEMYEDALYNFRKAIDLGKELDRYFAGYAALQSGIIYDILGQKEKAIELLNYCLDLDFEEYEQSIKYKAKARLSTIQ